MAIIKPFTGIRPCEGEAANIAALPYDVYDRKEATQEIENKPHSFLRIDRADALLPLSVDSYDERVYEKAHELLRGMIADGLFVRDTKPCYYLYEQTMDGRVQSGIVACAAIDDYLSGTIKKHENTRADKEEDRVHHVDVCSAQTGPIFLAYRANAILHRAVEDAKREKPLYDFCSDDGIRHRVFQIADDAQIDRIQKAFAEIDAIYIADGHHRCASAVRVGLKRREQNPNYTGEEEFNYFLSVLFSDDELLIMPYNRLVHDLNGYSHKAFLREVQRRFDVTEKGENEPVVPGERGTFSLYLNGQWYRCAIREEDRVPDDPVADLDVAILQEKLLNPVLGIEDPRTDERIDFAGGIRGIKELERRCATDCAAAFAMYPTSIEELFAVADAGRLMPPKSTWFEPKLRSGLFIHEIEPGI